MLYCNEVITITESKIIAVVGSRDLNPRALKEVERLVEQLVSAGHYILSDGSRTVGLKVMETVYRIDPSKLYVYLHCTIKRNPENTHRILNQLPEHQVLQIKSAYSNRNIFYRNKLLVEKSDLVIAFWQDKSADVQHVLQLCQKQDPPVPLILNEY